MKTPKRPGEWQAAAQAKAYGLIDENGHADMARALDLQARCTALEYVPRARAVEMVIHGMAEGLRR